jgi:hypothetical protein
MLDRGMDVRVGECQDVSVKKMNEVLNCVSLANV